MSTFGAIVLLTVGTIAALEGIAAISKDAVYVAAPNYIYELDLTTWGWIHLLLGVAAVATGIGIIGGQDWARMVGIALAVAGIIANFLTLPYYPWWSIIVIALYIAVIWALTATFGTD